MWFPPHTKTVYCLIKPFLFVKCRFSAFADNWWSFCIPPGSKWLQDILFSSSHCPLLACHCWPPNVSSFHVITPQTIIRSIQIWWIYGLWWLRSYLPFPGQNASSRGRNVKFHHYYFWFLPLFLKLHPSNILKKKNRLPDGWTSISAIFVEFHYHYDEMFLIYIYYKGAGPLVCCILIQIILNFVLKISKWRKWRYMLLFTIEFAGFEIMMTFFYSSYVIYYLYLRVYTYLFIYSFI